MISTIIMVWGIVSHVPFVSNVSIIAITITLLRVLSLLRGRIVVVIGRVVAGSVTIVVGRSISWVRVSIL